MNLEKTMRRIRYLDALYLRWDDLQTIYIESIGTEREPLCRKDVQNAWRAYDRLVKEGGK